MLLIIKDNTCQAPSSPKNSAAHTNTIHMDKCIRFLGELSLKCIRRLRTGPFFFFILRFSPLCCLTGPHVFFLMLWLQTTVVSRAFVLTVLLWFTVYITDRERERDVSTFYIKVKFRCTEPSGKYCIFFCYYYFYHRCSKLILGTIC